MPSSEWLGTYNAWLLFAQTAAEGMPFGDSWMDLYGSLGAISMECVRSCGICVSSIVKVRRGDVISRTQNVAQGRPIGCTGGSLCHCAGLVYGIGWYYWIGVLFGRRWALATIPYLNCASTQREIKGSRYCQERYLNYLPYGTVLRGT